MKNSDDNIIVKDIFIHFLDQQLLESHQIKLNSENTPIFKEIRLAIRLGLLLCENSIIIPVSNYFENVYSKKLLNEYSNFGELGFIQCYYSVGKKSG
jgi:hypothetical protein